MVVPHEVPPTDIFFQKKAVFELFLMIFGVLIENSSIFESFSMNLHCFGGFSRFWPYFNGFLGIFHNSWNFLIFDVNLPNRKSLFA